MNNDIIQGKWHEIKGKVVQQWGKITSDDLTQINGSAETLAGVLQKKYGYQKDQAQKEIETFLSKHNFKK